MLGDKFHNSYGHKLLDKMFILTGEPDQTGCSVGTTTMYTALQLCFDAVIGAGYRFFFMLFFDRRDLMQ